MSFSLDKYLKELEEMVNIESYSRDPIGNRKLGIYIKNKFLKLGWNVETINVGDEVGPIIKATNRKASSYDVLLLGHMDTVFEKGTVAQRAFKIKGDKVIGPGVSDMKSGDLFMCYLADFLTENPPINESGNVCMLFTSDEEISSVNSRPILEEAAKKSKAVLVLESDRDKGNLIYERKGIVKYTIKFEGVASHAGNDPEKGASAITEMFKIGLELNKLNKPETGTTLNIGRVEGGRAANIIPDYAECLVDIRITDVNEAEKIESAVAKIVNNPFDKRVKVTKIGGLLRPPMVKTNGTVKLANLIENAAKELGIEFNWEQVGGGSDGNFSAALGIPTVDGLGPIGGGAHSKDEFLDLNSIQPRFEMLTKVVSKLLTKK